MGPGYSAGVRAPLAASHAGHRAAAGHSLLMNRSAVLHQCTAPPTFQCGHGAGQQRHVGWHAEGDLQRGRLQVGQGGRGR